MNAPLTAPPGAPPAPAPSAPSATSTVGRESAGDAVALPRTARRDVTLRAGSWSLRVRRRVIWVTAVNLLALLTLVTAALMIGDLGLAPREVLSTLFGHSSDPLATMFVQDQRAPRVVAALVVGAALGVAGALFQGITGNPLGSPDVLGFTTGAATGALVQIIVLDGDTTAIALGALLGGLLTALVVHVLTRRAGLDATRLVLVGLGIGALLSAVNTLLVEKASLASAQSAGAWLAGSLNAVGWDRAVPTAGVVTGLVLAAVGLQRAWSTLTLGDDMAHSLGVPVRGVRSCALLLGVVLVSVATAAAGPLAFVALAAPQISRRMSGSAVPGVLGSALTGAVVVLGSDIVAQRLLAPTQLNVGVVTGALGGLYLVALLTLDWKRFRP